MVNYQNAEIYIIRSHLYPDKIYVGYTTRPLSERLSQHRRNSKDVLPQKKNQLYLFIKDWTEWYIKLYENYHCAKFTANIEEILKRENEVVREAGTLNTITYSRCNPECR